MRILTAHQHSISRRPYQYVEKRAPVSILAPARPASWGIGVE